MSKPFKLSATLLGHSLDVRSVSTTSENSIISGSRDKTAKFWTPNGQVYIFRISVDCNKKYHFFRLNTGYGEVMTYRDQKNFVMCVLYLEPTSEFPSGLVVTGGNDNTILIYKPGEPFATLTMKEHTNAGTYESVGNHASSFIIYILVCCLSKGAGANTFLSGSWDATGKLWVLSVSQASVATYSGHSAAVWSVLQLQNGNVVTASADKTIGIWSKEGVLLKTLQGRLKSLVCSSVLITCVKGHTDCVRGLADFPELNRFISVSNDAGIKVWSYLGDNVDTYYGHTNYIYR